MSRNEDTEGFQFEVHYSRRERDEDLLKGTGKK